MRRPRSLERPERPGDTGRDTVTAEHQGKNVVRSLHGTRDRDSVTTFKHFLRSPCRKYQGPYKHLFIANKLKLLNGEVLGGFDKSSLV